jgi:predicted nucleotidyltransferase
VKLEQAIKKTIKYSQRYKGQLTKKQLFERLIGNKIYTRKEIYKIIEQTLRPAGASLDRAALIKIKKAENLAKLLNKKFKDILFLGITGSVAAGYPKKNDDIDLMIIIQKNKLWLTRLKLRYFIYKNSIPHRRYGQKENRDEFCFNLWLDENNLLLPKNKQNLKNAVDLILIKPLINRNKTYEKFINANNWAIKYVATGYSRLVDRSSIIDRRENKNNYLDKIVNWMVFWPQYWYMKKRIKNEEIGLHEAFFHH